MRIALQPCSAPASRRHYRDTVENSVAIAPSAHLLGSQLTAQLNGLHPGGTVAMWGLTPSPQKVRAHAALAPGVQVLFAASGRYFTHAIVTARWRNSALAERLWGREDDDPAGRTWELMYALRDLRTI